MTVNALSKIIDKLKEKGLGRNNIGVDKKSLFDGNGTWQICDIKTAEYEWLPICDGDGFSKTNKNGSESIKQYLVLKGGFLNE